MRTFPRTAKSRRGLVAILVGVLTCGVLAASVPWALADDDLKDKQRKVEKKIDQAESSVAESSKSAAAARAKVNAAEAKLSKARGRLDTAQAKYSVAQARDTQMQAKLVKAKAELDTAREELRQGRAETKQAQEKVEATLLKIYEEGDPTLNALISLVNAEDIEDVTRTFEYRDVVVGEQASAYEEYQAAAVLLKLHADKVEDAKDEVADQRAAAAKNLKQMKRLKTKAQKARNQVAGLVDDARNVRAQAQNVLSADKAKLAKLEQENQRIESMLRARAEAARKRARQSGASNGGGGGSGSGGGGGWQRPVNGYVTSPFGYRTHPIYGYYSLHNGTDFGAGCGAPLYAPSSGVVASRYYQSAWGNRLIIDHGYQRGVGVASIFNHATRYVVGVGQRVSKGQLVGYVGSTGWSTGCHLHFTVTENGNPVNPMGKWL